MPKRLTESLALTTEAGQADDGNLLIRLISPGWGSSGYYSPQVIENAAAAKVWPAGTHMYFDHPSESERHDRPERSVRDLAAVLQEDAHWDGQGLVAQSRVIGPYKDLLTDPVFMESVGVSIVAYCETTVGEAEGRKGIIITDLTEGVSVDFVTRAGRGGRIMAALESARATTSEALTQDVRDMLGRAIKDAHPDAMYVSLRDHDPDTMIAYYLIERETARGGYESDTWAQTYELSGDQLTATLTGTPTQVRARTEYVPVNPTADATESASNPPVAPAGSPPESQEDTMPQIEESRLAQLEADAERATAAEARANAAEARIAAVEARAAATAIIGDADATFTALERRGLLADLPMTEAGALDAEAFTASVTEAAAEKSTTAGAGQVRGFGASAAAESKPMSDADFDAALNIKTGA